MIGECSRRPQRSPGPECWWPAAAARRAGCRGSSPAGRAAAAPSVLSCRPPSEAGRPPRTRWTESRGWRGPRTATDRPTRCSLQWRGNVVSVHSHPCSQVDRESGLKRPPHSNWPADTVFTAMKGKRSLSPQSPLQPGGQRVGAEEAPAQQLTGRHGVHCNGGETQPHSTVTPAARWTESRGWRGPHTATDQPTVFTATEGKRSLTPQSPPQPGSLVQSNGTFYSSRFGICALLFRYFSVTLLNVALENTGPTSPT